LRTDICFESELDVGQDFGNDYEKSKVASEKLVRAETSLESLTIYRPSIIIGDSKNGYSSTFHGYYTPLKIVHSFVDTTVLDGSPLLACLGLSGSERKYFVPVDWVAAAITKILNNPKAHGKTYNLTPKTPTTCETTLHVFEKALQIYLEKKKTQNNHNSKQNTPARTDSNELGIVMLSDVFREQMEVYKAYWRDDPTFDRTNTESVLTDLPCPEVTPEMLLRLAAFALDNGFGWPKPQPVKPEFWIQDFLYKKTTDNNTANQYAEAVLKSEKLNTQSQQRGAIVQGRSLPPIPAPVYEQLTQQKNINDESFGLQVNGRGGGAWTIIYDTLNKKLEYQIGLPTNNKPLIYINATTFNNIINNNYSFNNALTSGAIHIENPTEISINSCKKLLQK
jgi:hypothetical protein